VPPPLLTTPSTVKGTDISATRVCVFTQTTQASNALNSCPPSRVVVSMCVCVFVLFGIF
jgi:hypothetical protein